MDHSSSIDNAPTTSDAVTTTPGPLNIDIPAIFQDFLKPSRYKVAYGGRGSGKSHFFATLCIIRMLQGTTRIAAIREVQSSIKDSVKQLIQDKIKDFGLQPYFQILDQEIRCLIPNNDSLVIFKGLRDYNSQNIKSLEDFDVAWVEEAQTLKHVSLRMLRPTIRKKLSELWFGYNPRYKTDAVDIFFRGPNPPPNAIIKEVNWSDNPYFPPDLKAELDHDYATDPHMAHHIWGGGYEIITTGSYYGNLIATTPDLNVPYFPESPVYAAMDLGISDNSALWVFQRVNLQWHFLYFYQNNNQPLAHYADWLHALPGHIKINTLYLPHDAEQRELQSGLSRKDFFEARGFETFVVARHSVEEGIALVRKTLPQCLFDRDNCADGLDCLRMYKAEYDEDHQVQKLRPLHDWSSHGADALRYAIMGGHIQPNLRSDWSRPLTRDLHVVP